MSTTQKILHPPLEGTGFLQTEPSGAAVDTTVLYEPNGPEGAALNASASEAKQSEREGSKGRAKRPNSLSG